MQQISNEEIAKLAYELFLLRGSKHGSDFDDWVTAEHILRTRPNVAKYMVLPSGKIKSKK